MPLEVRYKGDKEITYELNTEDLGRAQDSPALPFNAFGTLAWARSEFDNNSASSQVFFLLKESELTPTGANLLDGRYAVFGYIVEGQELLTEMKASRCPCTRSPSPSGMGALTCSDCATHRLGTRSTTSRWLAGATYSRSPGHKCAL